MPTLETNTRKMLMTLSTFERIRARAASAVLFALLIALAAPALASTITIPTVPVGNAGNAPDNTGFGAVDYDYRIGTTEVTNAQYVAFLNAVAATDTYGLYSTSMGSSTVGGITRTGTSGSYVYAVKADAGSYAYANKPVNFVSWGDAARFSNWLHNGQPIGLQDANTTEDGAYTLNGATTGGTLNVVTRNTDATWFIPSENEWYKAAYYDGDTSTYYDYPTGTDSVPDNNLPSLDTGNSANFVRIGYGYTTGDSIYPLTDAGAYVLSASPYGTYDQGGNVKEWNEDLLGSFRGARGGSWNDNASRFRASFRGGDSHTLEVDYLGFRVATVPEPGTLLMGALGIVALLWCRKRRK